MSESVLEQSLQFASQETTAVVLGAAVLVAALVVLVGIRRRSPVGSGSGGSSAGEPISDGGTTVVPADPDRSAESADRDDAETPDTEELDSRLDDLEGDVEALSSAVKAVHNENEVISETVQDVEENTGRLLNLYRMATRGVNPFAGGAESGANAESGEVDWVEEETETIETDVADPDAGALFDGSDGDGPAIREEHCVDSVEEVVETESEPADAFQRRAQAEREEGGVEEIATGEEPATEGTDRVPLEDELEPETVAEWFGGADGPAEAPSESLGTEETIEAPAGSSGTAASDGGVLLGDSDDDPLDTVDTGDGPAIREEHCVDSVEEVVETESEPADAFQRRAQAEREEGGVEEIATGEEPATEGTDRVPLEDELEPETVAEWFGGADGPAEAPSESLGTEETIEAPAGSSGTAASDGGVLLGDSDDDPAAGTDAGALTEGSQEAKAEGTGTTGAASPAMETESPDAATGTENPDVESGTESSDPQAGTATPDPATEPAPAPDIEIPETPEEPDGAAIPGESEQGSAGDESGAPATPGGHATTEGKPYIESLPEGFGAEVITVEWLEYLIDEVGLHETVRAIHYYETIDWLTEEAAAELDSYLDGFDDGEGGSLSVDHHRRSLDYVEELTATTPDRETEGSE
jgi:flagellar protein FlaE